MKLRVFTAVFLIILIPATIHSDNCNNKINNKLKKTEHLYNKYYKENKDLKLLKKANSIFDSLITKYPNKEKIYWKAAESCYKLAEEIDNNKLKIYKKGKNYASKAIEINSRCGKGYFWKATLTAKIAQNKGITKSISMIKPMRDMAKKSIKFNPEFGPAYHLLAKIYTKAPGWPISIGDDKKALQYRIKSTKYSPDNILYKWELYKNFKKLNKNKKARKTLKSIVRSNPKNKKDVTLRKKAKKELEETKK